MQIPSFLFGNPGVCTYCGAPSTCIDHAIPLATYRDLPRKKRDMTGVRTYACHQCNAWLGSKVFPTFRDRVGFVNGKLVSQAQKFSKDASWSDGEIAELDDTLRTFIANRQLQVRQADARSSWQGSAGFWSAISTLYRIPHLEKDSPKFVEWVADYFSDYL